MLAITGATGFVGRGLVAEIIKRKLPHAIMSRNDLPPRGVHTIIDLAGLAHGSADESAFMQANFHRPIALFHAAKAQGVRRFIFVSSVAADSATSAYGKSKRAAELALCAEKSDVEVAIVRPPLVYGPSAPANFGLLTKLAMTGLPLPFASIDNQRSLIGRSNLVDALIYLALRQNMPKDIYNVTDGSVVSLARIIESIRISNGLRPGLFPMRKSLLLFSLKILGRDRLASQLFDDLVIDDAKIHALGWTAPLISLAPNELVSTRI